MKKFIIACLIFSGIVISLNAQSKHEILLKSGGGLSALNYATTDGAREGGLGWQVGIGYCYFFFTEWGLATGVQLTQYNSSFSMDSYSTRYMATDRQGDDFEFRSSIKKYQEKQRSLQLQIPLMLQFQTGDRQRFYAAAGMKAGIPVTGKYSNSGGNITNSGYYSDENYEYTTQKFMGFGTFDAKNAGGDMKLKLAYFVSTEVGMKFNAGILEWRLSGRGAVYVGVFVDYGLNNIAKKMNRPSQQPFIEYIPNLYDFTMNSVVYSQNKNEQQFTRKIHPIAAGIKIKLSYGKGNSMHKDSYPRFQHLREFKMSQRKK